MASQILVSSHIGIGNKTFKILSQKKLLPIWDNIIKCKPDANLENLKIFEFFEDGISFKILEFVNIKIF